MPGTNTNTPAIIPIRMTMKKQETDRSCLFSACLALVFAVCLFQFGFGFVFDLHPLILHHHVISIVLKCGDGVIGALDIIDRKSTRLNSSHVSISYAVFCLN